MSLLLLTSDEDDGTTVSPSPTSDTANISHTENLSEKVVTLLYGEVVDEKTGEIVQTTSLFSFDPDKIPAFQNIAATVNNDGTVTVNVLGDVDTESIKAEVDFDGDGTTDETLTAGDTAQSVSLDQTTTGTVARGDDGTVTVTLYDDVGQAGTTTSRSVPISRDEGASPSVAFAEITSITEQSCANGGYQFTIDYDTANFSSSDHTVELRVMADTNDDDIFGQLDIVSGIGESGTYTYDSDVSDATLESTTCGLRFIYFEVRVGDGAGTVFDSKATAEFGREFYDCNDGNCFDSRSNHL